MFVDASAIIAILTNEVDAHQLAEAIETSDTLITSAIAVYEATVGVRQKFRVPLDRAVTIVRNFLAAAGIEIVPITAHEVDTALDAFGRYGKGQGHPAQLNMGDCFAYAVAKNRRTTLLYEGNDFSRTDIRSP